MGTPLPPRDHRISKADAAKKTKRYKEKKAKKDRYPTLAFHGAAFERILDQPGCVGIRAYPAEDDAGMVTMILVGVDGDGNDMVDGALENDPFMCPEICPDENELNTE